MKTVEIETLRELCSRLPPGKLRVEGEDGDYRVSDSTGREVATGYDRPMAQFIAEAAPALPVLLDELERARDLFRKTEAERDRAAAEVERLRTKMGLTSSGPARPLHLYADSSGWLIAARSRRDLARFLLLEDIQGEGGWRRMATVSLVTVQNPDGTRVQVSSRRVLSARSLQPGVVAEPDRARAEVARLREEARVWRREDE